VRRRTESSCPGLPDPTQVLREKVCHPASPIEVLLRTLRSRGLEVRPGVMSTLVVGEADLFVAYLCSNKGSAPGSFDCLKCRTDLTSWTRLTDEVMRRI